MCGAHHNILWKREGSLKDMAPGEARTFIDPWLLIPLARIWAHTQFWTTCYTKERGGYTQTNQIYIWRWGIVPIDSGSGTAQRINGHMSKSRKKKEGKHWVRYQQPPTSADSGYRWNISDLGKLILSKITQLVSVRLTAPNVSVISHTTASSLTGGRKPSLCLLESLPSLCF